MAIGYEGQQYHNRQASSIWRRGEAARREMKRLEISTSVSSIDLYRVGMTMKSPSRRRQSTMAEIKK